MLFDTGVDIDLDYIDITGVQLGIDIVITTIDIKIDTDAN